MEATKPQTQVRNHHEWQDKVLGAKYRFAYFDGLNHFYVAEEHAALAEAFAVPPNFFDYFQLRPGHAYSAPLEEMAKRMAVAEAQAHEARVAAQQAREFAEKTQEIAEKRFEQVENQARAVKSEADWKVHHALTAAAQAEAQLRVVLSSSSWRITAPLRTVMGKLLAVRRRVPLSPGRIKTAIRSRAVGLLRRLANRPAVRALGVRVVARFPRLMSLARRVQGQPAAVPAAANVAQADPAVQQVEADIAHAMQARRN
ncbi:hypothetical protein E4K72_15600 [Oxalobacteraceae bacterium OM1]|nr:hypothetical protein E4K72_15600 [Oxalobacteraceae bacterium OM1]